MTNGAMQAEGSVLACFSVHGSTAIFSHGTNTKKLDSDLDRHYGNVRNVPLLDAKYRLLEPRDSYFRAV